MILMEIRFDMYVIYKLAIILSLCNYRLYDKPSDVKSNQQLWDPPHITYY